MAPALSICTEFHFIKAHLSPSCQYPVRRMGLRIFNITGTTYMEAVIWPTRASAQRLPRATLALRQTAAGAMQTKERTRLALAGLPKVGVKGSTTMSHLSCIRFPGVGRGGNEYWMYTSRDWSSYKTRLHSASTLSFHTPICVLCGVVPILPQPCEFTIADSEYALRLADIHTIVTLRKRPKSAKTQVSCCVTQTN